MDFAAINAKRAAAAVKKEKRALKAKSLWKPKAKRKKLPSMKRVKKECWDALSLYVRGRDAAKNEGRCLICGVNPIQIAYHIWPSSAGAAAKWNPLGIVGGCIPCNGNEKWNRAEFVFKHIELFGLETVATLRAQSKVLTQFKRHDFNAMTLDFTARLAALKGEPLSPEQNPPSL